MHKCAKRTGFAYTMEIAVKLRVGGGHVNNSVAAKPHSLKQQECSNHAEALLSNYLTAI